ncbi:hypothetical protein D1007_01484 [Hordeum vulgare]|nr:hypothetical protein D1007_01484 [Hordeum vulgare]
MQDEFPLMDEGTTICMDESDTVCLRHRGGAPSIDMNDVVSEEEQHLVLQPGKFTFAMLSFTSAFCKWKSSYAMTNKHRLRKGKGLERMTKSLGTKANFEMNTDSETIKYACKDILQKNSKNKRHKIKKKYFDTVAPNKVSTKSPVPDLTDGAWQALLHMWSTPRHKANFEMNTDSETIKYACKDILQKNSKNKCHKIKKKYFDTVAPNKVSTKSPVPDLTDGAWQALLHMWSTPRHKANFEMSTDSETIKYAFKDILLKNSKNRRHKIKNKYFDTVAANKVSTKSPVPDLTDGEWQALLQMWSTPRHKSRNNILVQDN